MRRFCSLILVWTVSIQALAQESLFSDWFHQSDTQIKLEALTGGRITKNKVTLLHLGKKSRPMRQQLIQEAKHSIYIALPLWYADTEGNKMLEILRKKKIENPAIDLRVMQDFMSSGATGDLFGSGILASLKECLGSENAVEWNRPHLFRPFHFSWKLLDNRLHEKIFLVDNEKLILGGMNIQNTYLQGGETEEGWHDTDILLEGSAVQEALSIFMKNWTVIKYLEKFENPSPLSVGREAQLFQAFYQDDLKLASKDRDILNDLYRLMNREFSMEVLNPRLLEYFPTPSLEKQAEWNVPVRLVYDNPLPNRRFSQSFDQRRGEKREIFAPYSRVMDTFKFLLENARNEVKIFIPYLTINSTFRDSLVAAARRGIRVEIITNSLKSHDLGDTAYMGSIKDYPILLSAGVRIYEWQGHEDLKALTKEKGCQTGAGDTPAYWPGNTLHTKAAIIDGSVTLIGSHNMNMRSEQYNTEIMALVDDKDISQQMVEIFKYDLDLGPEEKLPCPGGVVQEIVRPRRSFQVVLEKVNELLNSNNFKAGLLRNFRLYM